VDTLSKTRFGLMFVVHQVIVLWVVIVSAQILTASACNLLRVFGWQQYRSAYTWLLSGNPYFPVHIALGLLLGWLLARSLRDQSMVWVWVLPSILLGYAFVAIPTLTPSVVPFASQAGNGQSRFYHYFGWGCQFVNNCVDQSRFTRPFYASLAYSLGAFLALRIPTRPRACRIQFWSVLGTGVMFLVAALYDSANSLKYGWNWMVFVVEATPAGMGAYLILLALSGRPGSVVDERGRVA
jgi:hypothetical protein